MDKNNPSQELTNVDIIAVAKDIQENGEIGTASKRNVDRIMKATIKQTFIFNNMSENVRGVGARVMKLINSVRQGWSERDVSKDYDFEGIQVLGAITEDIIVNKYLEAKIKWNTEDFADTEAELDKLVSMIQSAIFEELPIEFEKRIIAMLRDGFTNGVDWYNDQGLVAKAILPVHNLDISDETATKASIKTIAKSIFNIKRLDNPMNYQPLEKTDHGYFMLISPEVDFALQEVGAYVVVGGDRTYDNFLGNKPTKILVNNIPVVITPAMPQDMPVMAMTRKTYYTALPTKMNTRAGFIGVSPTEMFWTTETGAFAFQMSYWNAMFSGIFAMVDTNAIAKDIRAFFKDVNQNTGDATIEVYITGVAETVATDYRVRVYNQYGKLIGSEYTPASVVGGLDTFTLVNQVSGTYLIEVVFVGGTTEQVLYRSTNYQLRNKTDPRLTTSQIVNKAKSEGRTVANKQLTTEEKLDIGLNLHDETNKDLKVVASNKAEADKIANEAKLKAEADEKAKADKKENK